MTWKLRELLEAVRALHGEDRERRVALSARGVSRNVEYATYHAFRSRDLWSEATAGIERKHLFSIWQRFFDDLAPATGTGRMQRLRFEVEASLIASARSLHAATDMLAPTLVHALALDGDPHLPENRLYPKGVAKRLGELGQFSEIVGSLREMSGDHNYSYVKALANATKHRERVEARYNVLVVPERGRQEGIRIASFNYRNRYYEACWLEEYVESVRLEVVRRVIGVGQALNSHLALQVSLGERHTAGPAA